MILPFHIDSRLVNEAIRQSKVLLNAHDSIFFDSMHVVHPTFLLPTNATQYPAKHGEIDRILARVGFGGGMDLNFRLIIEVLHQIDQQGGLGINLTTLVDCWRFQMQPNCSINLTVDAKWLYKHTLTINHLHNNFTHEHVLTIRERINGVIVPDYIIQYLHTALNCFSQHQFAVCLALSSIIIEGTLKDVLITRGYQFDDRRLPMYVGGLGTGLDRARNTEHFLTPADLPDDLDAVIKPIRNNLVHLSGAAFATQLPYLNGHNGIPNFTLGDFVKDPILVHDLLQSVSYFIEKMYSDLRVAGHLIP